MEVNKKKITCPFFQKKGTCPLKGECPYALGHMRCMYFMFGSCETENCGFFHDRKEKAIITKEEFCKSFKSTGRCPLENGCKFVFFHKNCTHFMMGRCLKGENCPFHHLQKEENKEENTENLEKKNKKKVLCQFFSNGKCKNGNNCENLHICKFFATGSCKLGQNCKFDHVKLPEQNTRNGNYVSLVKTETNQENKSNKNSNRKPQICKPFLKGECKFGKSCYNMHLCRHFLKGFCKLGENCTFKHLKPEEISEKNETDESCSSTHDNKEQITDDGICCICMDKPSTHATVPCGHMIYCDLCVLRIKFCAKCRTPIQSIMKIYK